MKAYKSKAIIFPYEGYNFEMIVTYYENISGLVFVHALLTNKVSQPVNDQAFTLMLQSLRFDVMRSKHDKEIKTILINSLKSEENNYKFDKKVRNFFIVGSIIILLYLIIKYHE